MKEINVNDIDKIENPYILDVRELSELEETGTIKGAVHIPMNDILKRVKEIPQNEDIYILCRSGNRSKMVGLLLGSFGFNTINLEGGIMDYKGETVK
ncbi:rhodanese-like domain-containing protein [Peptoniphilus sp. MSJ-1]|uniref:Rhodanese-like domain-containing protein n=1 Tax=Peptoniphilus ovalis TaxID=2841503 RepID=A0ABS6FIY2_9FIRM|nr:rhodanese-like domain-containing protein [Peptoniphilus ovalis]MBU5670134.1 rhodanese-like domain-containing protein [Peptoniphilus ovalis]